MLYKSASEFVFCIKYPWWSTVCFLWWPCLKCCSFTCEGAPEARVYNSHALQTIMNHSLSDDESVHPVWESVTFTESTDQWDTGKVEKKARQWLAWETTGMLVDSSTLNPSAYCLHCRVQHIYQHRAKRVWSYLIVWIRSSQGIRNTYLANVIVIVTVISALFFRISNWI